MSDARSLLSTPFYPLPTLNKFNEKFKFALMLLFFFFLKTLGFFIKRPRVLFQRKTSFFTALSYLLNVPALFTILHHHKETSQKKLSLSTPSLFPSLRLFPCVQDKTTAVQAVIALIHIWYQNSQKLLLFTAKPCFIPNSEPVHSQYKQTLQKNS